VLKYGEHKREVHGFEPETTKDSMELMAAVRALECLTRPVKVQVWTGSQYVHVGPSNGRGGRCWNASGTTGKGRERDVGLWGRLVALSERHEVEWILVSEDEEHPDYIRASELAAGEVEANEPDGSDDNGSSEGPSVATVLDHFLAYRREHCSARTFKKSENVISSFKWSIDWYAENEINAIPASEITDHLDDFFYTLVHKNFATPSELKAAKSVLSVLLKWLKEQRYLEAATVESEIEDIEERTDEYGAIREFVDALSSYADSEAPDVTWDALSPNDKIDLQYLRIREVGDEFITFADGGTGEPVGTVAVPPHIAEMAEYGWEILLTAARVDGEWRLLEVVNGER
jgi:ribonuclease HI